MCSLKPFNIQVIVVENEDGEEEGVKELVPPLAVTGLLVKPTHYVSFAFVFVFIFVFVFVFV